jgi:hypothetical protein
MVRQVVLMQAGMLIVAVFLLVLGLAAAITRRHPFALVIGAQLAGLGAVVAILALLGPAGQWFAALVASLSALSGLLLVALQNAAGDRAQDTEEGDPLRW